MTAVVCNGYYLIADHRTTRTPRLQELHDHSKGKATANYTTDMACKIIVPPKSTRLTLPAGGEQSRIIGAACTGNANNKYRLRSLFNSAKSGRFFDWSIVLRGFCSSERASFRVIFVTENNHTVSWTVYPEYIERFTCPPGHILSVGTGGEWMNMLRTKIARLKVVKVLTPEEVFLTGSYVDRASSSSYSVLGVDEKILYTSVIPDPEHVKSISKAVWEKLFTEIHSHPKF